ncbi:oxalocrotonate tautomerase [Penicillium hispanicum]|uniref:oxalocrotonate tautomerase n=1 Tax=Penicillium hispanicum TaxID=1080232 RepID=UPI002541B2D9|nr:oxalocrotonate tautomerase [Penicillium hispanicum]KAJ5595403.1 oxalocrotonate tautomerase [Penicillium hispanicum]
MPLWQIYHPHGTFEDDASKQALAADITKMYLELGLPAFYVVTHFYKMDSDNVYVGGKERPVTGSPFVRVVIIHIAVYVSDVNARYVRTTDRLDQIMKPHLLDKGYDFEYHIAQTDRRLWKINGLVPPPYRSNQEQIWARENRPVPYEGGNLPRAA